MNRIAAIAFGTLLSLFTSSSSRAMTVDEIVSRNIDARGGLSSLRAIHSMRTIGHGTFGGGDYSVQVGYAGVVTRTGKLRNEITLQGLTGVDAWDGASGWGTVPWEGRRDPFRQAKDESNWMAEDADIDGPLVDWRSKGHVVDYLGTEDIDGTLAHKLRIRLKDGNVEYDFLDPDTFLQIRIAKEVHVRGAERVNESDLGAYQQVAGIWIPFEIESGGKGEPRTARFVTEHVEVNVDAPDSLFGFPATGVKVERMITGGPATALAAPATTPPAATTPPHTVVDSGMLSGLGARNIGSAAMSGRVAAVAAFNEDGKTTLYVGAASGGVWKSVDTGTSWKPVFDMQTVQSIGAVAIDPSHPKTVWVGTGEAWTRNSVSIGDGIYKSTDAGTTWTNTGLPESERVARILVHPTNGDVVYACVPGKLWSDSADRGVYKTTDGGKRWSLVLKGSNLSTGCSGLSMDPKNPDVLLAGMWDFRRKGWTFRSGGDGPDAHSGSALFRTSDGGTTWTPITAGARGLPAAPWGRVEVEFAPSDANVVYALIESKSSALFRSADGGTTWERRDDSQSVVWRPFYFARLVIDPTNPDRLFKPDLNLVVSEDGGRSFSQTGGGSHGDWHDLWIDPANPKHVIGGDDGGLWTSFDGGTRWWKFNNLPISQFYHVSLDDKDPYQVYGGLQDNGSWIGQSAYPGGITNQTWETVFGGDGFWTMVDPTDPDAIYAESQGGFIGRANRKTLAVRSIRPEAGYNEKLRFNWNTPIHASPRRDGTIYIGAQFLFRSRDRGDNWERISPDLTTNDKQKQRQEESGGVTVDNSSAEMHTTIYSISESPKDPNLIWVGTDDGNLQLTRDAGKTWTNVIGNVKWLPKGSWVSWVEASRFDPATAYAAFDRHTFGDMEPWVYRTTDTGKTWTRIVGPWHGVRGYAHVVKEDAVNPSLLFLGTELGLWISVDSGAHWAGFKGNDLPSVAVRDLQVHAREGDLVVATHGRGMWIIDDLTPLRAMVPAVLAQPAVFLPGRAAQQRMQAGGGAADGDAVYVGQNPAGGAVISYYQATRHLFGPIRLEVLGPDGKVIETLNASKRRGINRVNWSMHLGAPRVPRAVQLAFNSTQGVRVLPGTYTVRLTKGGRVVETKLEVGLDKRAPYSLADRKAQFDAAVRAGALFNDMSALVERIDAVRKGAEERAANLGAHDPLTPKLRDASKALEEARKKIVATKEGGAITGEERIREHLDELYGALTRWEGRPATYQVERITALSHELDDVARLTTTILTRDVTPLQTELQRRGLPLLPTEAVALDEDEDTIPRGEATAAALGCLVSHGNDCEDAERAAANQAHEERD